jgi:hypothetical protein
MKMMRVHFATEDAILFWRKNCRIELIAVLNSKQVLSGKLYARNKPVTI